MVSRDTTIGVNARTFHVPEPDGAVVTARTLTERLIRRGYDVHLFGSPDLSTQFDADVSSALFRPSPAFGVCWERTVLPALVRQSDVDVLFCPNGNAPPLGVDVPVVTCVHDVNARLGMSGRLHRLYRKVSVPLSVSASDLVVTVSEFSRGEIVEELSVDKDRVRVVYNGVDEAFFQDGPGGSLDLPSSYVLYVGAANPRKNVEGVIAAFESYRRRHDTDLALVLIGPENKLAYADTAVEDVDHVHRLGYVSRPELVSAYRDADLFLFPSFYEGFGLPPLEAMACGTPVVAGRTSALPEILGEAAEFVDPNSTADIRRGMERVLCDETHRAELVKSGRRRASEFSWKTATEQLLEVFDEAVTRAR